MGAPPADVDSDVKPPRKRSPGLVLQQELLQSAQEMAKKRSKAASSREPQSKHARLVTLHADVLSGKVASGASDDPWHEEQEESGLGPGSVSQKPQLSRAPVTIPVSAQKRPGELFDTARSDQGQPGVFAWR